LFGGMAPIERWKATEDLHERTWIIREAETVAGGERPKDGKTMWRQSVSNK
jgi:hypothetical protein